MRPCPWPAAVAAGTPLPLPPRGTPWTRRSTTVSGRTRGTGTSERRRRRCPCRRRTPRTGTGVRQTGTSRARRCRRSRRRARRAWARRTRRSRTRRRRGSRGSCRVGTIQRRGRRRVRRAGGRILGLRVIRGMGLLVEVRVGFLSIRRRRRRGMGGRRRRTFVCKERRVGFDLLIIFWTGEQRMCTIVFFYLKYDLIAS